jgi:hypothetical protein
MKKKLLALVTAVTLAVTSFSLVPVMAEDSGQAGDYDAPAWAVNWNTGFEKDIVLGEPVTGLQIKFTPEGYASKYLKREFRIDGPAEVGFSTWTSWRDETMMDGYEKYNVEGIIPSDKFWADMELTFTEPGLYTCTARTWDEDGNQLTIFNKFITVTENHMYVDTFGPAPYNFKYEGVEDGKYLFTWDAVPGPTECISYQARIFGEGETAMRRVVDTDYSVPVYDENGNTFKEKVVATDIKQNRVLLDPSLFTVGKEYRMLLATASSNGEYGRRDDDETPVGRRIASTTFVAEDPYVPQTTTYTVKIDGTDYQTVEEGSQITLPTASVIGYFADGQLYKTGAKYTVNSDVNFSTVKLAVSRTASVKYTEPTAIRFVAKIQTSNEAALASVLGQGMLITTSAIYNDSPAGFVRGNDKVIDIANTNWYNNVAGQFCSSLVGIKEKYYAKEYAARAYATVKYSDDTVATVYSVVNDGKSVQGVAAKVKADSYNTLTAAQKALIDKFAAAK